MAVSNGVLQSFKLQRYSVISMLCGGVVKAIGAFLLPAVKLGSSYLGIYASPISTFLFYLTITVLNFYFIARHADVRLASVKLFIRPLFSAILCGATAAGAYALLAGSIGEAKLLALIAIGLGAVVYVVTLLLFGGIDRSDIELIPAAGKLINKIPVLNKLIK